MSDDVFERYVTAESDSGGKFWEVRVEGADMHIRYGKIGQDKPWKTSSFASPDRALKEADKKLKSKLKKGYVEATREGGTGAPPAATQTFDEKFGEIRSLTEQTPKKSNLSRIKALYTSMWAEDRTRTASEVAPYLKDKFASWPDSYFTYKVKRVGNTKAWPKDVAPLLDATALDQAPFSTFARGFVMEFEGRYEPGDDVEVSDYAQRAWVDPPVRAEQLVGSEVGRGLKRIELRYSQLCETQQYATPATSHDVAQFVTKMPDLEHLTLHDSWSTRGVGEIFARDDVQARLRTLDLLKSVLDAEDVEAITRATALSGLTKLALRAPASAKALDALCRSDTLANLEELTLTDISVSARPSHIVDGPLAESLASAPFASNLKTLRLVGSTLTDEAIAILLGDQGDRALKTLDLYGTLSGADLDALEQLPETIALKTLITSNLQYAWDDAQRQRLTEWAASRKVKLKHLMTWDQVADY